ncbi:hypothetical protein RCH09_001021 [Actimicrobium sp. GrIS 1.19]|uniref:hypothetical protein n=1 Tax=Actimicrobium sp. GrIS 1.19 TaxID=3071708 RepID=UPI002E06CED7|nr:hypothetical protein [Actimicrobium sp. GrIS 1.19]
MSGKSWVDAWMPSQLQQSINPWRFVFSPGGSQYGLLNFSMKSSDPEMERDIVENVASYGRQLGRLNDVVTVLLKHIPLPDLETAEQKALAGFQELANQIAAAKAGHQGLDDSAIEGLIEWISFLKMHDPTAFKSISGRLASVISPAAAPQS